MGRGGGEPPLEDAGRPRPQRASERRALIECCTVPVSQGSLEPALSGYQAVLYGTRLGKPSRALPLVGAPPLATPYGAWRQHDSLLGRPVRAVSSQRYQQGQRCGVLCSAAQKPKLPEAGRSVAPKVARCARSGRACVIKREPAAAAVEYTHHRSLDLHMTVRVGAVPRPEVQNP